MDLILMTAAMQPTAEVLPALGLLPHSVTVLPLDAAALVDHPTGDLLVVDARRDLAGARSFTRVLAAVGMPVPVVAVLTEGGLVALLADWAVDDIVLDTSGPAELDAQLRLAVDRKARSTDAIPEHVNVGALSIDETTYSARLEIGRSTSPTRSSSS